MLNPVVIFKTPDLYCSFPSIISTGGTNLLVAFREASQGSAQLACKDSPCHHDMKSSVVIHASSDSGKTWSFLSRISFWAGINDPALSMLKDGRILVRWIGMEVRPSSERSQLQGRLLAHRSELGTVSGGLGNFYAESLDGGKTWGETQKIDLEGFEFSYSRDPITELTDGTWILPAYQSSPFSAEVSWLIRSWDRGKSWCDPALIVRDINGEKSAFCGTNFNETSVIELAPNKLLACIRADSTYYSEGEFIPVGGVGELHFSFSENNGLSWTPSKPSGIYGQPGSLLLMGDGKILCTYGVRKKPYRVCARVSFDDGNTWGDEIVLKDQSPHWDMGYPMSTQTKDGKIHTVYYWVDEKKTRYIESVAWSFPR